MRRGAGEQEIEDRSAGTDAPAPLRRGYAEQAITDRLVRAIFEHRLPPGARITETQLASAFGVSRTVVRQAIAKLCELGVFIKEPNQGCSVAAPSREQVCAMLDVRRIVEPEIARRVALNASDVDLAELRAHLRAEAAARMAGDRPTLVRLTGEFHLKLAQITGNAYLTRLMTELQILTCLAVLLHSHGELGCPRDDHSAMVAMLERRDADGAAAEMLHHISHIEAELNLDHSSRAITIDETMRWMGATMSSRSGR
jgi:DNA-binding GntR family transcriptional regulator